MTERARSAGTRKPVMTHGVGLLALALVFVWVAPGSAQQNSEYSRTAELAAPESKQRPRGFLFQRPIAQIGLRGGFSLARTSSSLFDFTTEQLTLDRSDFNAVSVGGDLAFRVMDPVDLVFSFTYSSTSKTSEFRDYVDQDDLPITQRTTFTQVPLTASIRAYLMPRGREIGRFAWVPSSFAPYIGAGGGAVRYTFRQVGSFVDYQDLSIFDTTFESYGWSPLAVVMAGMDFSLGPRVVLNTDARYHWASGELSRDFADFDDGIDLSGLQLSLGVLFRL